MSQASSSSFGSESAARDRRRSRLLLASACTLLAVGVGVNVHRHFGEPEALDLTVGSMEPAERTLTFALESPPEVEEVDEAGGQGARHLGEEGRMGRPSAHGRQGLYALRGPNHAVPQMARTFDPELAARNAGILGQMAQDSGHFLANPYGAAFSVGNDDEDVWGGVAEPSELAELAVSGSSPTVPSVERESYAQWVERVFVDASEDSTSTFSIDVDTGAYSLLRRSLVDGNALPHPASIRVEEMINYFDYAYPEPTGEVPISITSEVGPCPWDPEHRLVHVGLQGRHVAPAAVPPRNLVFLVDVSGSMSGALPLVVSSMAFLGEQLGERDSISIVVYAGSSGVVLPPTSGADKATILGALERLEAGGSTNGGEGIELAYRLAAEHFVEGGINRVVLATDGDFNVGVTSEDALVQLIEAKRRSGVYLSVLGFGGSNYQDARMEQLADHGNGNYAFIDGLAEARKVLVEQAGSTLVTIAKDVKIQVDFDADAVEGYRLVGYDNRVLADRDFADDTKDAGEIGSGHTVTALYEIVPRAQAAGDEPLMQLKLRYKDPDGERSKLVQVPVHDRGKTLAETSDDFRFSAAVVGFAQRLQRLPTKAEGGSLEALRDLALRARGGDHHCRRAELVELVERASGLMGHPLEPASIRCTPTPEPSPTYAEPMAVATDDGGEPFDWKGFVIEVLYLLPPLLALPLFVMALRRPRRRRRR